MLTIKNQLHIKMYSWFVKLMIPVGNDLYCFLSSETVLR